MMLAIFSRVITYFLAVISDLLLLDHDAGGVETFDFEFSSSLSRALLNPFVKWDSVHMLKIASQGYQHEYQLVFFPLFPAMLHIISSVFSLAGLELYLTHHELLILSAVVLNLAVFVLAHKVLVLLIQYLVPGTKQNTLDIIAFMFCFNPAGIFFSVSYTEALFSALSWLGFLLYARGHDSLSVLPLCMASFVRSNGSLNVIVVGLMWMGRAARSGWVNLSGDLSIVVLSSAILLPGVLLNLIHLHILCSESLACATCLCPMEVSNLLPTLSQWFLHGSSPDSALLHISSDPQTIAMCASQLDGWLPPVVYTYLQLKYWNVGFLRYFQFKQIPNFMLAMPIWCASVFTIYKAGEIFSNNTTTSSKKKGKKKSHNQSSHLLQMFQNWIIRRETPFVVHLCALLLIGVFIAHTQISTRLICSASPIIYVGLAYVAEKIDFTCNINVFGVYKKRISWVYVYIIVYNVLGIVLHSNFYPWT